MEKLDFFSPSLIVKIALLMPVFECEFSPFGTEQVDVTSVMLQRMVQNSH